MAYNPDYGMGMGNAVNPGSNTFYYPSYNFGAARQTADRFVSKANAKDGVYSGNNIFLKTWFHYQFGGGEDLNVSASALDFSFVSQNNLSYNSESNTYSVNLFSIDKTSQTSLALGKISLSPVGSSRYTIINDYYDFNIEWNQGFSARNIGTLGAGIIHGPVIDNFPIPFLPSAPFYGPSFYFGGPYNIVFHGTIYIKP